MPILTFVFRVVEPTTVKLPFMDDEARETRPPYKVARFETAKVDEAPTDLPIVR